MSGARRNFMRAAVAVACVAGACKEAADPAYVETLTGARAAKDAEFRADTSPLTKAQRTTFRGLQYFAPDARWRVEARFETAASPDTVRFLTTGGSVDSYVRAGKAFFECNGKPCALTLFRQPETGQLFLPFTDTTTGESTYGAGRYVDVEEPAAGVLVIDFNRAYNPYCAYNSGWVCPVAPPENHLDIAVRAGEKNFGHGA